MRLPANELAGLVIITLAIGLSIGVLIAQEQNTLVAPTITGAVDGTITEVQTKLVAVDREGNGVITNLSVRTVPGNGRILVDIDGLLFFVDTQHSMQVARDVAENYLNATLTDRDLVYGIEIDNTTAVGGESAGGALTAATIAALSGRQLRNDTIMTGTINPDGTIGNIGGVLAKARAAREAGYAFFLVPEGQGTYIHVEKERECTKVGRTTVCSTQFKPVRMSISKEVGIEIIEVETITDVVEHFLQKN